MYVENIVVQTIELMLCMIEYIAYAMIGDFYGLLPLSDCLFLRFLQKICVGVGNVIFRGNVLPAAEATELRKGFAKPKIRPA